MKTVIALLIGGLTVPALAAGPVATLVVVKTPPGVTRAHIEGGFKASVPTYQKIPGLIRKYYTLDDTGFGGVYLWKDRAAAEARDAEAASDNAA